MSVARHIVDLAQKIEVLMHSAGIARMRIINAVGDVRSAESLRDADLDNLLADVALLCQIKTEVTEVLRQRRELGQA